MNTRSVIRLLTLICLPALGWATPARAAGDALKFPSPDGRFAVKLSGPKEDDPELTKGDIVEKATGKSVFELAEIYTEHVDDVKVVWSPDSKYAAFGSRGSKNGETQVLYWDGAKFNDVKLPATPEPDFHKLAHGKHPEIRIFSDYTSPVSWLKSNELALSEEVMTRDQEWTSEIEFTVKVNGGHDATMGRIVKKLAYLAHD